MKSGQLCLSGGMYGGKRVVSSEWIAESTEPRIQCGDNFRNMMYGYLWWTIVLNRFWMLPYSRKQVSCVRRI